MKKSDPNSRSIFYVIRHKYQNKRHTKEWKRKKLNKTIQKKRVSNFRRKQLLKSYIDHQPTPDFSFINNTNSVLKYFIDAEKLFKKRENLNLNISNVENLTPDTIALLVANINDKDFHHNCLYEGNAPKKPELNKLFRQSGFYNFVNSIGFNPTGYGNLLHKEKHYKVVPNVAKEASLVGIKHVFESNETYEPLYEILIECMSNTNNHANPKDTGKCNWWLYVYNDPNNKITSYSFLDLGVGIFGSVIVQNYVKQFFKGSPLYKNINLVDDLLNGKIQSRVDEDKEIRGKGIPQIVNYSKLPTFKEFYIITNNVKINVKNGDREELDYNLGGTFLYWELQPHQIF